MVICHRANTLDIIRSVYDITDGVEIDVRYNSKKEIVLCHDYDDRDLETNVKFSELLEFEKPLRIILDIKVNGLLQGYEIADYIHKQIEDSKHTWELCSFNELCMKRLLQLGGYRTGIIISGLPLNLFTQYEFDFISIDYNIIADDIIKLLRGLEIDIYIWNSNNIMDNLDVDEFIIDYIT